MSTSTPPLSCPSCHAPIVAYPASFYLTCLCPGAVSGRPPYDVTDRMHIQTLVNAWRLEPFSPFPSRFFVEDMQKVIEVRAPFIVETVCMLIGSAQISPHPWSIPAQDGSDSQWVIILSRLWGMNEPGFVEVWVDPDGTVQRKPRPSAGSTKAHMDALLKLTQDPPIRGRRPGSTIASKEVFLQDLCEAYAFLREQNGGFPTKLEVSMKMDIPYTTFKDYLKKWLPFWPPQ